MKEFSRINLAPNIALYTPQCKQLQNFISSLVPPDSLRSIFLRLYNGMRPPYPYHKLNTDGNALGNPGLAGVGGCCEIT